MKVTKICDDIFDIGNIAFLLKTTHNEVYDFNFRNNFECKSIVSSSENPVLLHIGAIENYSEVVEALEEIGMKPLISEEEHLRCSTIEKWYPVLKDKTPFTVVYDKFPDLQEVEKQFSFPIFIKGNRQTNRHKKSQCIIENAVDYEKLKLEWEKDPVLYWQKIAIREYVPLKTIDEESFPDQVPISYEFRFFCFEGKCMGYGPYWYMGQNYSMAPEDKEEAVQLAEWAAGKLSAVFPAIDLAKTADGRWILIEVNDAQESGFVGLNSISLWRNVVEAAQDRTWIPVEDFFEEGTVIMAGDPLANVSLEEMTAIVKRTQDAHELVDLYVKIHNKFWFIEDDLYDYEKGTPEYNDLAAEIDAWGELMDKVQDELIIRAKNEGLMDREEKHPRAIISMEPFMKKYGYRDGRGWWVRNSGG